MMFEYITKNPEQRFLLQVTKAIKKKANIFSAEEKKVIDHLAHMNTGGGSLSLSNPRHIRTAAVGASLGLPMMFHFGNFLCIASHPHPKAVEYVNMTKGRPKNQAGSITTIHKHIRDVFDWSKVPKEVNRRKLMQLIDDLYKLGPFGFRGPAAKDIPSHLTRNDDGVRTVQMITPGYGCVSNRLVKKVLKATGSTFLYATSPNVSHHATGRAEEPAHYRMKDLRKDFAGKPGYFAIVESNENLLRDRYPKHDQMSTSILAFHKTAKDSKGRTALILERHGSLHFSEIKKIALAHGFHLVKSEKAQKRLIRRTYHN